MSFELDVGYKLFSAFFTDKLFITYMLTDVSSQSFQLFVCLRAPLTPGEKWKWHWICVKSWWNTWLLLKLSFSWVMFTTTKSYPAYYDHLSNKIMALHFRDQCSAASLCYRNCAKMVLLMCEQKTYMYLAWFFCQHKSNLVNHRALNLRQRDKS